MPFFTKLPVTIEAVVWTGDNTEEIKQFCRESAVIELPDVTDPPSLRTPRLLIKTEEGALCASYGDYIIKGVKGEFYPCKPDIFHATYREASAVEELKHRDLFN